MIALTDDQTLALLEKLIRVTRDDRLTWERQRGKSIYGTIVGEFYYRVLAVDGDGEPPFMFDAHRMGTGMDEPLVQVETDANPTPLSVAITDLFEIAERKTLGLDGIAEKMLDDLDRL